MNFWELLNLIWLWVKNTGYLKTLLVREKIDKNPIGPPVGLSFLTSFDSVPLENAQFWGTSGGPRSGLSPRSIRS